MIDRTRRNFVIITMALLLALTSVFIGATVSFVYGTFKDSTLSQLQSVIDADKAPDATRGAINGQFQRVDDIVHATAFIQVQNEAISSFNYQKPLLKEGYLKNSTDSEVAEVLWKITQRHSLRGKCGQIYFVTTEPACVSNVGGIATYRFEISAVDCTTELTLLEKIAFILFLCGLFELLVTFVITWVLSYKVIKPVEDAFTKQKQFVSDASHELRTPVTIIKANVDVISSQEGSNEWLENISSQTSRMTELVNDMLTLSKLGEEHKTVKVKSNVSEVVESVVLSFETLAYEYGKTFVSDVAKDVYFDCNTEEVKKVCNLLLDNAVKYSESVVNVSFYKNGNRCFFKVVNDGSQIASSDKYKIFERFYRGDSSRTRDTGGSGLGLAVVKALAEKNKWHITVNSDVGKNMEITVEF